MPAHACVHVCVCVCVRVHITHMLVRACMYLYLHKCICYSAESPTHVFSGLSGVYTARSQSPPSCWTLSQRQLLSQALGALTGLCHHAMTLCMQLSLHCHAPPAEKAHAMRWP